MRLITATAASSLTILSACANAQTEESLTRGYTAEECPPCAGWNQPQAPFKIHGNTYYVGTRELAAILITGPEGTGHILIDGALPNSAPQIIDNIRTLGFRVEDIDLILNSHAHYDHSGGIAAIQRASGARVAASPFSARVFETGKSIEGDPTHGILLDFPAIPNVEVFADGDTLRVGTLAIAAHLTPGHTPGGTTWTWRSCDDGSCLDLVYADSQTPISAPGFKFSSSAANPTAVADFRRSHQTIGSLACDILVTPHPGASSLWERLEKGPEGLIDRNACRDYAARASQQLDRRLESER